MIYSIYSISCYIITELFRPWYLPLILSVALWIVEADSFILCMDFVDRWNTTSHVNYMTIYISSNIQCWQKYENTWFMSDFYFIWKTTREKVCIIFILCSGVRWFSIATLIYDNRRDRLFFKWMILYIFWYIQLCIIY